MTRTILQNANLIDGDNPAVAGATVVVSGDRIAGVHPQGREVQVGGDDVVVDLEGRSLLPGLITTHFHSTYSDLGAIPAPFGLDRPVAYQTLLAARNLATALRKATTVQDPANACGLVNLVDRDFVPEAKDQLWYGDITYIFTMSGWAYLAAVIDGYSRKVVGWSVADHMREELVIDAFRMAVANRRPGTGEVVFHSDRGSQYTGRAFRDVCLGNGIIPSVGQTGICFDNAAAESWNATFKKELIHLHSWKDVEHVRQASFEFVEVYYNRQRIQKGLGYLTPSEYELGVDTRMAQVA